MGRRFEKGKALNKIQCRSNASVHLNAALPTEQKQCIAESFTEKELCSSKHRATQVPVTRSNHIDSFISSNHQSLSQMDVSIRNGCRYTMGAICITGERIILIGHSLCFSI